MIRAKVCLGLVAIVAGLAVAQTAETRSLETHLTGTLRIQYLVQLPSHYRQTREKRWPLLVYLHGGSARGTDIALVKRYGPPAFAAKGGNLPFVLVSPQCPEGEIWRDTVALVAMIDAVQRDY